EAEEEKEQDQGAAKGGLRMTQQRGSGKFREGKETPQHPGERAGQNAVRGRQLPEGRKVQELGRGGGDKQSAQKHGENIGEHLHGIFSFPARVYERFCARRRLRRGRNGQTGSGRRGKRGIGPARRRAPVWLSEIV